MLFISVYVIKKKKKTYMLMSPLIHCILIPMRLYTVLVFFSHPDPHAPNSQSQG